MSEEKKQSTHHVQRNDFAFGISLGEWVTSATIGIASGILTAAKTIRDRFHHDLKNSTKYQPKFAQQAQELADITLESEGSFKKLAKTLISKKIEHYNTVSKWAKEYRGVEDSLIKGTWQRARIHSPRSKASIIFNGLIGTAVGAGMMLSFFNGVATRAKIEKIEEAVTAKVDSALPPSTHKETPELPRTHPTNIVNSVSRKDYIKQAHHLENSHADHRDRIKTTPEREVGVGA